MKKLIALSALLLVGACCSDAFAADEFGSRFGDSSPYALGNTVGKATDSATTMGLDDLNTITPTAEQLPPPVETSAETELNAIAPAAGADSEAAADLEADAAPDLPAPSNNPPVAAQPTSEQLPNP